ncbi:interferon-related developmental regulator family protein / IFRD protein family [Striga hermonthica]|uniref:Interferon-related developmental regulator family protein / IFRD protein family n=1 Tax=Striga hermonthica TaxID=68872 RepID=A0A9N7RQP6_STRHE|nr:interferon-related developmental regulator family protein / IFRD protein family [Striga hermonthica]
MGRRSSAKKNSKMLDSDDTESLSSSSSSMQLGNFVEPVIGEVLVDKDTLLDESLDALYEKRGSTRQKALASIIEAFNSSVQHEFVEKKFATLLHQCLNSIKKGSAKEVTLACHAIGLLALTSGPGEKAHEILEESVSTISEALRIRPETSKILSLLECLAIITFVGGEEPEKIEESMQIMWQMAHPKLGPNVAAAKPSPAIITTVVSAWSFLLTTISGRELNGMSWQESVSYLSTLLDKDDRQLRIAAGEALALIFEVGSLEKFCGETKVSTDDEQNSSRKSMFMHGLKNKVLNQVRGLSSEASGRGSAKKDLNNQRNTFRDILEFIEDGYTPVTSMKIGGESLHTSTWAELIQLNFLKHFLGGGFVKHMQDNQFLHDVFGFMPKKKLLPGDRISGAKKRMYRSPNSVLSKARTQLLNKQRMLSQDKNAGHFAVGLAEG